LYFLEIIWESFLLSFYYLSLLTQKKNLFLIFLNQITKAPCCIRIAHQFKALFYDEKKENFLNINKKRKKIFEKSSFFFLYLRHSCFIYFWFWRIFEQQVFEFWLEKKKKAQKKQRKIFSGKNRLAIFPIVFDIAIYLNELWDIYLHSFRILARLVTKLVFCRWFLFFSSPRFFPKLKTQF
jgi:hypothetical protein